MTNKLNKEVEESWRDRFAKKIVPSIDDALYEYHFTENHENPRQCVYDDLKYIEEFIEKELLSTRAEAREATLKQFWLNEFASEDLRCCLCRNGGMLVDMNGIRRNCICPNGRSLSKKDQ